MIFRLVMTLSNKSPSLVVIIPLNASWFQLKLFLKICFFIIIN